MNYRLVAKLIGRMLTIEAALMLAPLAVSLAYGGQDAMAFVWAMLPLAALGAPLSLVKPQTSRIRPKGAFVVVALSWILFSLFGALPFYFSGHFASFVDCLFESVSGFSTVGATILADVESLPRGILFWRSFSHWIGGLGILVFMLAIMPTMNASSIHILRASTTGAGLSPDRFVPRIRETAKVMYLIYLAMTALLVVLLLLAGLPPYDALTHAFSTAGTGGFSSRNAGIAAYGNAAAEGILAVFMLLFGVSFLMYFYLSRRNFRQVLKDEELRLYGAVALAATVLIGFNLLGHYGSATEAARHAAFQVSAMVTTTGFATADFNAWPVFSRVILLLLMLAGCCAGSTGGGFKLARILLLCKAAVVEMKRMVYPKSVKAVTLNGVKVEREAIFQTAMFLFTYFAIFIISTILLSLDGKDVVSTVTASLAALSNSGTGLGLVGPGGDYAEFSAFSKVVLSFCMIAGRLEIFPLLILLSPSAWKRHG